MTKKAPTATAILMRILIDDDSDSDDDEIEALVPTRGKPMAAVSMPLVACQATYSVMVGSPILPPRKGRALLWDLRLCSIVREIFWRTFSPSLLRGTFRLPRDPSTVFRDRPPFLRNLR